MKQRQLIKIRKEIIFVFKMIGLGMLHPLYYFFCILLTPLSILVWFFNNNKFLDTWYDVGMYPMSFLIIYFYLE